MGWFAIPSGATAACCQGRENDRAKWPGYRPVWADAGSNSSLTLRESTLLEPWGVNWGREGPSIPTPSACNHRPLFYQGDVRENQFRRKRNRQNLFVIRS